MGLLPELSLQLTDSRVGALFELLAAAKGGANNMMDGLRQEHPPRGSVFVVVGRGGKAASSIIFSNGSKLFQVIRAVYICSACVSMRAACVFEFAC